MIRGVLAVLLAVALVGATVPALEDARRQHTARTVGADLATLERRAQNLVATDDAVPGGGARRVVTVRVPRESWADAGVDRVTIGAAETGPGAVFSWTVAGGRRHSHRSPAVPLATPDRTPLTLVRPGRHRIILVLGGTPRSPAVTVRRFKSDEATSRRHARAAPGWGRPPADTVRV